MANIGAFIAADKDIIGYLKYNLRSQMFAKAFTNDSNSGSLKRWNCCVITQELKINYGM
jgi:glycine C-acetyltransferase